ncbi:Non-lysosomal glucosylceramidase [Bulinus truncatus]|nr:Non-lysosomal glucosylceramidase [Bulinus truncatus]
MESGEIEKSLTEPLKTIPGLPDYGWRVPLTYECKVRCRPFAKPRMKLIPQYIALGVRYFKFWVKKKRQGRRPFIDHLNQIKHKPIYGCPIGGIGSGSIGRGYRGEFCRFQMVPGMYNHSVVDADQFIVCIRKNNETKYIKVLNCSERKKEKNTVRLKSWDWSFPPENGIYHALYPRAWSVFNIPEMMVTLICRQVSPVIPHDYLETTLPAAVFIWEIQNHSSEDLDISITFTFKNGQGTKEDLSGGVWCEGFACDCNGDNEAKGVLIHQYFSGMKCSYGIAAKATDSVSVTVKNKFNPSQDGADLWNPLKNNGHLDSEIVTDPSPPTSKGEELASGVCASQRIQKNSSGCCEFSLCWDMPQVQFASKETFYTKRYCRMFSNNGSAAEICSYALRNHPKWEAKIEKWQKPMLESNLLPAWYKSALFNELYYISDGGTVWFDIPDGTLTESLHKTVIKYGRFAYLEGQEYRMFNTYDVHHYSSFALLMLWPKLQLSLQYEFGDTVTAVDKESVTFLMSGQRGLRKVANCIPHDIGDPEDEPWIRINAYNIHPTHDWKDLNIKFVLQVYRDYSALKDKDYLLTMYPKCKILIDTSRRWDTDQDGIIDNGGFADQTFDAWDMTGASAYCGGMWLAALRMMVSMAEELNEQEDKLEYQSILDKGKESFTKKLWNGSYYNFDCSESIYHDSVMADQLAGYWFLKASDLIDETVFPSENVKKALSTIFKNNVMGFKKGFMGAINSTRPNGKLDQSSPQTEEFWVGVTYALAATMIQEGLIEEGFHTACGAYHICWNVLGLHFQTPEAYTADQNYRSLAYMRPLAIWAMQWAIQKFHPHLLPVVKMENDDTFQSSLCDSRFDNDDTLMSSMFESRTENDEMFQSSLYESKFEENEEYLLSDIGIKN